jgi:hypothetical protein
LLIEFARSSPIEFDLALQPRRVFSSALRCSAPQRLELLVALLGILDFGGRDGGTNAKGQRLLGLALALAMSSGTRMRFTLGQTVSSANCRERGRRASVVWRRHFA